MTCIVNERGALNTKALKKFFEEYEIIAMQANKSTSKIEEINRLLVELGNAGKGIPFTPFSLEMELHPSHSTACYRPRV